jgi:circadian clock protein KaiB
MINSDKNLFKGIALFTPAGDLIYCIDYHKKGRWHLHLCSALQQILELPEPPHFLVPAYTATIDQWLDPHTKKLRIFAEVHPAVQRHQSLLNAVFQTPDLLWEVVELSDEFADPLLIDTYRSQFPQLWEDHDLIVRFDENILQLPKQPETTQGYVFRVFVSGHNTNTATTLQLLHKILQQSHLHPYTLKIIDVLKDPDQAESNQITATPTLVRVWPLPMRRIVGNFDDTERILNILTVVEE